MLYEELSGTVIGAKMEVHKMLGSGFLESARLFESVESVESVAFLFFGPIRSESGGKLLTPTSDYTPEPVSS